MYHTDLKKCVIQSDCELAPRPEIGTKHDKHDKHLEFKSSFTYVDVFLRTNELKKGTKRLPSKI